MNTLTTKNSSFKLFSREIDIYNSLRKKIFHPKSDVGIKGKKLIQLREGLGEVPKILLDYLEKSFLKEKIISAEKMNVKSTFHALFLIKTKNKKYVLKMNALHKKYTDFSFFLENFIQKKLKLLHVPSIATFADISKKRIPYDFLLMEFVKGVSLADYKEGKNIKEIYRGMGKLFKKIHTIKVEGAGILDNRFLIKNKKIKGMYENWNQFFLVNLNQHIAKSLTIGVVEKEDIFFIKDVFKKFSSKLSNKNLSLLHNDPGTRNIFTDGKSITGILDWEDAIVGDPLWEIAFIHTFLFRKEDEEKFNNFCKGYGISSKNLFTNPVYWLYYLRISLLKIISRGREGYYNEMGFQIDKQRVAKALIKLREFKHL